MPRGSRWPPGTAPAPPGAHRASCRPEYALALLALLAVADPSAPLLAQAGDALRSPPTLKDRSASPDTVEVSLTAAPARLVLLPGAPATDAYAYNGTVPGPTLDVREGEHVIVHFRNELEEPTTIHWHGLHLPAGADGSPFDPVPPGGTYDYVFDVPVGTAGTYWYHPHPDRTTTEQVAHGLYGAVIIRAAHDPLEGIPERLLILSDNRFRPDGSIDLPAPDSRQGQIDLENGREGNVLFVNGQVMPTLRIRSGEVQRWRVVDAAAARVYRLAIPGQSLLHVGSDGGLFEHPREVPDMVLANSGRVELLVRGSAPPGSTATLRTLPYDRYDPHTRPADWDRPRDLLTLRYDDAPAVPPVAVPSTLRAVAALDTTRVAERRVLVFSQGMIDNKKMDMNRVDLVAHLGTTEIWEVDNVVGMDHPFHLHGFRFQILDRDGVPEPYPSWNDTVNVPKHGYVRIVVRFDDFAGKWMYHCHILDHEDAGMMGILQVQ